MVAKYTFFFVVEKKNKMHHQPLARWTLISFVVAVMILSWLTWGMQEGYENWDFMDFADMCGMRKKRTAEEVPHFGGVPSSAEVWTI